MTPAVGYTEMKDSGFPDIGNIPSAWTIMKVKHIFDVICGATPKENPENWDGNIPWIGPSDMPMTGAIGHGKRFISELGYTSCGTTLVPQNSIIISTRAPIGKICIAANSLCTNQGCKALVPRNKSINNYFFAYYLRSIIERLEVDGTGTTFKELSTSKLLNEPLIVPPIKEQTAIATYLDTQCAKIDEIIAEAKASIEDYKKWKASIIYEAVTKGLDPTVEMKDSGVEWIGEIPKGWNTCKTLYVLSMAITDGPHTTPELFDDGIPFISAEAVSCGNGYIDFSHKRGFISEEFYQECCKKYVPQIDDIYMIKSGATTGRVAIVNTDIKFTIWSPLAVFRANQDRVIPRYLYYFVQSSAYQKQVEVGWSYGTQQNIGMRTLETLKVCLPPLNTQADIVETLDRSCTTIDKLIFEKQELLSDLEAYKKSLIYEVVTGKRKVC